jgi:BirA family biotin operon repressor/biotin-[acetyl-CoA-carboxylase] ligase
VVLTAWAAVATGETILALTGLQARVKWPNDLLLGGRKVSGILIEQAGPGVVVAGVGLNVAQQPADFESAGLTNATSLAAASGQEVDVSEAARRLLLEMDRWYDELLERGPETLEACWKWRTGLLGRPVVAECTDGSVLRGRLREQSFGGLRLDRPDGTSPALAPEAVRHLSADGSR